MHEPTFGCSPDKGCMFVALWVGVVVNYYYSSFFLFFSVRPAFPSLLFIVYAGSGGRLVIWSSGLEIVPPRLANRDRHSHSLPILMKQSLTRVSRDHACSSLPGKPQATADDRSLHSWFNVGAYDVIDDVRQVETFQPRASKLISHICKYVLLLYSRHLFMIVDKII